MKSVNPNSERMAVVKFWFALGVIRRCIVMKYFPSDATALKFLENSVEQQLLNTDGCMQNCPM